MHKLICGTTMSGKTTLAKRLAALYRAKGRKVIVLDELLDPEWNADFITDSPEKFQDVFWASRNCAVFIDEAGDSVGRYNKEMNMTATRGRHWGHICHYISQRPSMLSRNVISQCLEGYAFLLETEDAETLAKRFVLPPLKEASNLSQGEYIYFKRFGENRKPFADRAKTIFS